MNTVNGVFVCLVIATCVTSSLQKVTVDILTPTKDGPEAAIIIVPGALISGSAYKPLAERMQGISDLKLWVALLDGFFNNVVNPIQLGGAVRNAVSELKKKGVKHIFLAGHSLGGDSMMGATCGAGDAHSSGTPDLAFGFCEGTLTANYVLNHHRSLTGAMLFGSYLTRGNRLVKYPVPVLTLSGDLDGLTRITRIQESFEELMADMTKNKSALYRTPVLAMEGVNHAQFASGVMPDEVQVYDIEPDVTNLTAYDLVSWYTDAFMKVHIPTNSSMADAARTVLMDGFMATSYIMAPLTNMRSVSTNPLHVSQWAGQAQFMVSGLKDMSKIKIPMEASAEIGMLQNITPRLRYTDIVHQQVNNVEVSEGQLIRSTPEMTLKDGTLTIRTYTEVANQLNPLDVSTFYMSPIQLQAELKTRDAIRALLPNETFLDTNETCFSINQAALQYALVQASPVSAQRFAKRGRPIIYEPDVPQTNVGMWYLQELQLADETDGLHVLSESFHVPYNSAKERTSGLYYCKLLAPYRAMEWVYVDGLRKPS